MRLITFLYLLTLLSGKPLFKDIGDAKSFLSGWPRRAPAIVETRRLAQKADQRGSLQEQALTWTMLGRCYLNQPDYNRAIVCYSKAESLLDKNVDYQLEGVLHSDISETYRQTHDYLRALHYAESSVAAFSEAGDSSSFYLSLAALAAVHQKLLHWHQADSLFSLALPHLTPFPAAVRYYISLYAEGKMVCGEADLDPWGALDLLYKKREVLQGEWSSQDYAVGAFAYAMLHLDQTCDSLLAAIRRQPDSLQRESAYLQYRIALFRNDPAEALRLAEEVLKEKDRKTTQMMAGSLSQTLQNYYADEVVERQKEIQQMRAKGLSILFALLLGATLLYFCFERRRRIQLAEKDRILRLSEESARILEEANANLKRQAHTTELSQASLRKSYAQMFKKQYVALGALCDSYFYPQSSKMERAERVLTKVENLLAYISEDDVLHSRLEEQIDNELGGIMTQLRQDLGPLPKTDARVLCYHILGFRASTISTILNSSPNAVYIRLSRIREKITHLETPNKERYLQVL